MNISYIDNKIYILLHSTSSFGSQKGNFMLKFSIVTGWYVKAQVPRSHSEFLTKLVIFYSHQNNVKPKVKSSW